MTISQQIDRIKMIMNSDRFTSCDICGFRYLDLGIGTTCQMCLEALESQSDECYDNLDDQLSVHELQSLEAELGANYDE